MLLSEELLDEVAEKAAKELTLESLEFLFRPTTVGEMLCRLLGIDGFSAMLLKGDASYATVGTSIHVNACIQREQLYVAIKQKLKEAPVKPNAVAEPSLAADKILLQTLMLLEDSTTGERVIQSCHERKIANAIAAHTIPIAVAEPSLAADREALFTQICRDMNYELFVPPETRVRMLKETIERYTISVTELSLAADREALVQELWEDANTRDLIRDIVAKHTIPAGDLAALREELRMERRKGDKLFAELIAARAVIASVRKQALALISRGISLCSMSATVDEFFAKYPDKEQADG